MKTVTSAFVNTLKTPATPMVRQVYYKRRYWVESAKAYTWDSSWTALSESNVVGCSPITWQLDIQTLNEFKTSNITLVLDNTNNQWNPKNPYGIFAQDSNSPVFAYEPFFMKFQIKAGVIESDHTTEAVAVFTGVLTDYNIDSQSGQIQLSITGEETLLINSNAEDVSTSVTNETATGTVDGANKVFTTAHNGVGIVSEVSDNGLTKRAGVDYTLSALNTSGTPATITFAVAPTAGHTVRVSYIYWKASQKFEDLVALLLTQAGISGGNQNISPVIFPNNIINTHAYNTQADWVGGLSLTDIDTTTLVNSIKLDFQSTDARQSTTWMTSTSGWTFDTNSAFWNASGSNLKFSPTGVNAQSSAYRALASGCGRWDFTYKLGSIHAGTTNFLAFYFMVNGIASWGVFNVGVNGYAVVMDCTSASSTAYLYRYGASGGNPTLVGTLLQQASVTASSGVDNTITVVRYPSGRMVISFNGSQVIDVTDTTYTTGSFLAILTPSTLNGENTVFGDSPLYIPAAILTGTWISNGVDFGSTPTAYAQFQFTQTLNGGSVTMYTASSADNISYDAYVQVNPSGQIGSVLRRYLRTKIVMTSTQASNNDPLVTNVTVGSITSSTVVTLANFTGMTVYDAITSLGKFANYEFGFGPNEVFYFRPKNPGQTPVMTLDQTTYNMIVQQILSGNDRVYSIVRASYGSYITTVSDDGNNYVGPLRRIGQNRLDIDGGNILISSDADVATGVAGSFFGYFKYPRRLIKVTTKCIPQLDLSDVVQITFADNLGPGWYIGDTSMFLGDSSKYFYGAGEQILYQLIVKVVGVRLDTDNWTTEFDLEEVLV